MIDILVPVLGRPANVGPFLESVTVTKAPHRLIFICSKRDRVQIEACRETGAETWVVDWNAGRGDFARKINWAYERTEAEWVFQGADDIRFHPGWDSFALGTARRSGKRVIGTNDLHNPLVKRQLHSTHTLFARSYIEELGGTEDGTGKVFCELYDHQFVDTEFIEVAKRREEWVFSPHSHVEHLHPAWGLAHTDPTYQKAVRHTGLDFRLYRRRMGLSVRLDRRERRLLRIQQMEDARQR